MSNYKLLSKTYKSGPFKYNRAKIASDLRKFTRVPTVFGIPPVRRFPDTSNVTDNKHRETNVLVRAYLRFLVMATDSSATIPQRT